MAKQTPHLLAVRRRTQASAGQSRRAAVGVLVASNVLGGVGMASGGAVGALLTEQVGSTAIAGLGQAAGVLGAAVAAVPLATLAARAGRRWALSLGYLVSTLGGVIVVGATVLDSLLVLLLGLSIFGIAQSTNLQSRYAASELAPVATRARTMTLVIWATTFGSVAGPNLGAAGERLGMSMGIPGLAGPFLFSVATFALAAALLAVRFRPVRAETAGSDLSQSQAAAAAGDRPAGALSALRWGLQDPGARLAVVLIAVAHAVMVMVMSMTPLHMTHAGMGLELVGVVISAHVLGMFALSPVFGWLVDRHGAVRVAGLGVVTLAVAVALGLLAASGATMAVTTAALVLLGLGWSACLIASSALLADVPSTRVRVPLQGATDALMMYAAAGAAALSGPIVALGGFRGVNLAAAILLAPAAVLAVRAAARSSETSASR